MVSVDFKHLILFIFKWLLPTSSTAEEIEMVMLSIEYLPKISLMGDLCFPDPLRA